MNRKHHLVRRLHRWLIPVVTPFLVFGICWAADRQELGELLNLVPSAGPAEQYGNVMLRHRSKKAKMPPVVFPHWVHRSRYVCSVCHTGLDFAMRSGGSGITREKYLSGKYCGACHNGVQAFTVKDGQTRQCHRCHLKDTAELNSRFRAFAGGLPTTQFGNRIDWAAALADGSITPAKKLAGKTLRSPEALQKDLNLGTTAPRSKVSFSHEKHLVEMDCNTCHPEVFNVKKKGTTLFSMELNLYGQFCGVCHMRVAFPMTDCRRCHPDMSSNSSAF